VPLYRLVAALQHSKRPQGRRNRRVHRLLVRYVALTRPLSLWTRLSTSPDEPRSSMRKSSQEFGHGLRRRVEKTNPPHGPWTILMRQTTGCSWWWLLLSCACAARRGAAAHKTTARTEESAISCRSSTGSLRRVDRINRKNRCLRRNYVGFWYANAKTPCSRNSRQPLR
jgi:hypothetical protein